MRGEWSNGMLCSRRRARAARAGRARTGCWSCRPGLAAPGHAARGGPRAASRTWSSTSTSRPTGPTPCAWPAWPGTWPPPWASRGHARYEPRRAACRPRRRDRRWSRVEAGDLCPRFTATVLEGVPDGPVPGVDGPPPDAGRDAADQRRGRRVQLRDARPRPAQPRLRPRPARRRWAAHPAGPARRAAGDPRRRRAGARTRRTASSATPTGTPVGVGGIMGGSRAEIGSGTRRVLLEAAWFNPMADRPHREPGSGCIRRPGSASSGASTPRCALGRRPVRGLAGGRRRATGAGGRGSCADGPDAVDVRSPSLPAAADRARCAPRRVNAILGTTLDDADVAGLLAPIGFAVAARRSRASSHGSTSPAGGSTASARST